MQANDSPDKILLPFAESGAKQAIPVDSQIGIEGGRASYTDGFPPATRTAIAAGGIPPWGTDFNGIFYAVTNLLRWQNGGGFFKFDQALSDAIGGYPQGAKLIKSDGYGFWESLVDDNTDDPDVDDTNWQLLRAQDVGYSGGTVEEALDDLNARDTLRIGAYQEIQTNLTGAQEPDQSRWIKLTAGEDGAGQYNEGKLINETITGSGDTVVITAEISDVNSPMNGQVVNLINSENRYTAPGESAGTVDNDQMQQITGQFRARANNDTAMGIFGDSNNDPSTGSFSGVGSTGLGVNSVESGILQATAVDFDSANSPDARTGTNTNVKRIQVTAYIKFKE